MDTIIDVAVDLFLEGGFHATRIDDIALAANVSRRTFFNYFPTKQDVFAEWFRSQGNYLATYVAERPADEDVWASLRLAYDAMHGLFGRDSGRVLKLRRILALEPVLLAKKFECLASTMSNLTPVVEQRLLQMPGRSFAARVLVHASLGAYNSACADWEARPKGRSFGSVLKRAFALAEPAITRSTPVPAG